MGDNELGKSGKFENFIFETIDKTLKENKEVIDRVHKRIEFMQKHTEKLDEKEKIRRWKEISELLRTAQENSDKFIKRGFMLEQIKINKRLYNLTILLIVLVIIQIVFMSQDLIFSHFL